MSSVPPARSRRHETWPAALILCVLVALSLPLMTALTACGESASQVGCLRQTTVGTALHRIRNGTCVTEGFENVARIAIEVAGGGTFLCTGTLIAPNVILSAGHCVNPAASSPPFAVSRIQVDLPRRQVSALVTHYTFTGGASGQPLDSTVDMSVMRLDRNLAPTPASLAAQDPAVGQQMLALGYGYDGNGADGNGNLGDLLSGQVVIDIVGSASRNIRTLAAVQPISSPSSQDTCAGDSGGPLVAVNATNVVYGVLSGGNYIGFDSCKNSADSFWSPVRWNATQINNWKTTATTTITNNGDPPPSGWTKL